ncbi:MAG: hypothetical protein ABIJ30_07730 [bacterium]
MSKELSQNQGIFSEIKSLIEQTRQQVAVTVNAAMTILYRLCENS